MRKNILSNLLITEFSKKLNSYTTKLVTKCLRGNQKAHKEIYNLLYSTLFGICRRYSSNIEDAEDSFQEAFINVYRALDTWDSSKGDLTIWAKRITINSIISHFRKNKRNLLTESEDSEIENIESTIEVDSNINYNELISLLDELPKRQRIIFSLYAIEGFSHKEIGEQLEIKDSTSRSQYLRAKTTLIKRYNELYSINE